MANQRRKRRQRRRHPVLRLVLILLVICIVTVGTFLFFRYRTYSAYNVTASLEIGNTEENTNFYAYQNGYIKCTGDSIIYFDKDGIIWSESYSIRRPIIDICGEYIAVADTGQRNVFLYDKSGFVNRINFSNAITEIEVSRAGVVAAATNDDNINYLEVRDRDGNELLIEKSNFTSRGFLMDISLSDSGEKLAAIFVSIDKGILRSSVDFYDLSGGAGNEDVIVGRFNDYESVLLTTVQFVNDSTVCAVGDVAMMLYKFDSVPEVIYEDTDLAWQIQSLFFDNGYIGMVVEESGQETNYMIKVFDTRGRLKMDFGTDFTYSHVDFAGRNILMYNGNQCRIYSFAGVTRFAYDLYSHIEALISNDGQHLVYGTNSRTEFLTLK